MRIRRGAGCVPWLLAAVAVGFADWHPWLFAVAAALVVATVAYLVARRR